MKFDPQGTKNIVDHTFFHFLFEYLILGIFIV